LLKKKPVRKSDSAKFFTFAKSKLQRVRCRRSQKSIQVPRDDLGIFPGFIRNAGAQPAARHIGARVFELLLSRGHTITA
jgi:hypothetical protein